MCEPDFRVFSGYAIDQGVIFTRFSRVERFPFYGSSRVAGDGSERENLQNSAKNLGLNIIFLGHQKNIAEFYKKSKIFVISSFSEGLPNVLIESAFYKCARISSATVGAKELIKDEKDGLLFKIGDAKELAKKLEILMKDEKLQKKLIENANESLVNFMPSKILKQWEKIIETVVNK